MRVIRTWRTCGGTSGRTAARRQELVLAAVSRHRGEVGISHFGNSGRQSDSDACSLPAIGKAEWALFRSSATSASRPSSLRETRQPPLATSPAPKNHAHQSVQPPTTNFQIPTSPRRIRAAAGHRLCRLNLFRPVWRQTSITKVTCSSGVFSSALISTGVSRLMFFTWASSARS